MQPNQHNKELTDLAERKTSGKQSGRNDPCPCGSGLKYKKCCGLKKAGLLGPSSPSKQKPTPGTHSRTLLITIFSLIVLLAVSAYSNSFQVPFVFDDGAHIKHNRAIHLDDLSPPRLARLKQSIGKKGRAVAELSFAFNYYLDRLDPFGYHLFNLIVHILTAFGIYLLIVKTMTLTPPLQDRYGKIAQPVAALTSLIFVVHPVNTQAVTYIVQRMTSMGALFFIASLLAYIKGRQSSGLPATFWYAACLLSALLALGSKQNTATLPLFIGLYEIYFFQALDWQRIKKKLAVFLAVFSLPVLAGLIYTKFDLISRISEGYKTRPFTMGQRALTQLRVVIYYISLLFYPHPSRLNLDYDFPLSYSLLNPPTTLLCLLIILGLLGLAFYLAKQRQPVASFCILWFFGNLVIESSIYPLDLVYEHRLYLPSLGFLWLFSLLATRAMERWLQNKTLQKTVQIIGLSLILGIFAFWTQQRNRVWHSVISILEDVVAKSPNKARQHVNLGVAYSDMGKIDKAIQCYLEGIRLDPYYPESYNNLGNAYNRKNMLDEAIPQYLKAIKMRYQYKEAHNNLGSAYYKKGMYDEAIKEHLIALEIQHDCEKTLNNLGVAYSAKRMYSEAVATFEKAIAIKPYFVKPYLNLGLTYIAMGQGQRAIHVLTKALKLTPNDPSIHYNLGNAYSDLKQYQESVAAFQRVIRLQPKYAAAYNNLGLAYRGLKQDDAAIAAYKKAIALNPRQPEFHYNLGLVYLEQKRYKLAVQSFQTTTALSPNLIRAHYDLATTWQALGQYQDAIKEYQTLIKLAPMKPLAYQTLGQIYAGEFRNHDKARYYLQKALQLTRDPIAQKSLRHQISRLK